MNASQQVRQRGIHQEIVQGVSMRRRNQLNSTLGETAKLDEASALLVDRKPVGRELMLVVAVIAAMAAGATARSHNT